jgi:hypothetical protein
MTTPFDKIATRIIKEQELIIGPLAWEEARKVPGVKVIDPKKKEVHLEDGDLKVIIDRLVAQYERLFGRASHEVCKEVVQDLIAELPPDQIPPSLK